MKTSVFALSFILAAAPALITCTNDIVDYWWTSDSEDEITALSLSMPVGAYTGYGFNGGTCGLAGLEGPIGAFDNPQVFAFPLAERTGVQLIWMSGGDIYLEYLFPALKKSNKIPKELKLSFEMCSETGGHDPVLKSDITIWINGKECGTWTSMGDFADRQGIIPAPAWWSSGHTQYGNLVKISVSGNGTSVNSNKISGFRIDELNLNDKYITLRIGIKDSAENKGGFNIFGSKWGDYPQDILLSVTYFD
ncbi:MAG: hypothetical protein LBG72_05550 [Spirochaetaceae bacterium]|jgi:predicted transcriptional regulator|nr:hypothetical protein [Spirochaetaceae bacterium]